jgi:hypothetical protein
MNRKSKEYGRVTVKICKFAAFFLQKRVAGGDIWAEYITIKAQVNEGYIPGRSGDPQFSIPVLYR